MPDPTITSEVVLADRFRDVAYAWQRRDELDTRLRLQQLADEAMALARRPRLFPENVAERRARNALRNGGPGRMA